MLDTMRTFAKTWIAKILLAVLVVSFGAFGISNVITDLGSNTVVRVGSVEITARQFERAYRNQLNQVAQQIGKVPTSQEAMALGIPSQVIGSLSADAAVDSLADQLGLGASDAQLARMLQQDPNFAGTLGQFDRNVFASVLQNNGFTEAEYFTQEMQVARRQQIGVSLFGDAAIPETAQDIIARYGGDKRTLDYFIVGDTAIGDVPAPTDTDLAAYLKDHQADFRTKETRTVDILDFSPETIAATKTFTDAEIAAEYEKQKASLTKIEKRHIEQVALPDDAALKTFTDGQAAGTSFTDLVKQAGLSTVDLGTLTQAQVTDPDLAKAAFSLPLNGMAIIPGIGGKRAITVTEIQPGGTETLAEAKDQLTKALALQAAKKEYADDLDQIEALRAAFKPLPEIAQRFNLKVTSVELTSDGAQLSAVPGIAEKDRAKIASAIFKAEPKKLSPTIALGVNNNVWFDIKDVAPARDQTLAEVHDAVAKAWTAEKTAATIEAKVKELTDALAAGKPFDQVAQTINQIPQLSEPITRNGNGTSVLTRDVAAAAFDGPEGHFGSAKDGDGDYVIFKVEQVTPATDKAPDQTRTFVANAIKNDLYAGFVTGVRDAAGMRINQAALNQLLALNTGN